MTYVVTWHHWSGEYFFGAQLPCRRSKSVSWCTKLTAAILLIFIGTLLFFISHICVLSAGQYDLPKYLLIILRYYFVAFISKDSLLNHKESVHTKNFPLFEKKERTHTSKKPYSCQYCNEIWKTKLFMKESNRSIATFVIINLQ